MSWFPVGLNMTATLVSELRYTDTPAEASQVGLKPGTWPLTLWRHKGIVNQRQFDLLNLASDFVDGVIWGT